MAGDQRSAGRSRTQARSSGCSANHRSMHESDEVIVLRIDSPSHSIEAVVDVVADPAAARIGSQDVVLLCVKSQDTAAAVATVAPVMAPGTAVVCLQNGVTNEEVVLRYVPDVYGAAIVCPSAVGEPGVVRVYCEPTALVDLGRYPAGIDATVTKTVTALSGAGVSAIARDDVMAFKWQKLLQNVTNAPEALCGVRDGELGIRTRTEAETVLDSLGIAHLADQSHPVMQRLPVNGEVRKGTSTWESIARGGSIETDWLNGEIVRLARQSGMEAPVNELVQRTMWQLSRSGAPPGSIEEGDLLAELPPVGSTIS